MKQQAAAIDALTPADAGSAVRLFNAPPSYWLDLRSYQPVAVAQRLKVPMLILQGARDYQVTVADFDGWRHGLAGRASVSFKLYQNLFHPFIPVPADAPAGLATPAAYNVPGHVDPHVVSDIAAWVRSLAQ